MKNRISFLLGLSLLLIVASSAHAQATQTWVSGVGDDFNPCSRTAPCRTLAQAISVTAPGGEISVLDPGDFGTVTITKSITINGDSTHAGITTPAGATAVIVLVVPPPPTIPPTPFDPGFVILRGLSINGASTAKDPGGLTLVPGGLNGIQYMAGATLVIDHCSIYGFTGYGVHAEGRGIISVANSLLTNNKVAVQAETGATVRLSNNEIFDNQTAIGCGTGMVASWKNNKITGPPPTCAPTLLHMQ